MASAGVSGAHLTGTTETSRPTVFEILSQDGFANALKPAAAHVVKVLAERNPSGRFAIVYRYFDELYLTFDAVVQWHYFLTRGATLSEAFYGLERKVTATSFQKIDRFRLPYIQAVLQPYIAAKLDKLFSSDSNSEDSTPPNESLHSFKHLPQFYSYFKMMIKAINIFYILSYAFGRSDHHNLTFKLLRMTLGYTSEERSKFMEEKNAELLMTSQWKDPKNLPKLILRSLGESILFAVEIGTFFIQFLEWWNNDEKRAKSVFNSPTVPPPSQVKSTQDVQNLVQLLPDDMNKCPLCRKNVRNPTAISVSGVVYCYGCIFPQLKQSGLCPLTKIPCNINHLIRVYQ